MEGNKDEAIRCISIAEECILAGNKDKALKFLYKAEKLYSTQKAKDLIEKATMSKESSSNIPSSPKCRRRETNETFRSQKRETSEYTSEQITQVERIKKCKDYYEILGVTKEAGDAEIKKSYRKLALMLHPDKNKAPGATEAFKAVGNAFGVLTNPDKRKEYDLLGAEPKTTSRNNKYYEYSRGFEADMSAEDLFNVFFGPGFGAQNTVFMRRNGFWHRPAQEDHQHTHAEEEQAGLNIGSDDYVNEQSNFYSSSARDIHNIEYMWATAYDLGSGNFSYSSANCQHANVWTWGNSIYYKNDFDKSDNLLNSATIPPQENDNYNGHFNNADNTYYNNYIFQYSTNINNNGNVSDKRQYYAPANNGGVHSQYTNNSFYSGSNLFYSNRKSSSASEMTPSTYPSFISSNITDTNDIYNNNGDNVYYPFCANSDKFNASFASTSSKIYPATSSSAAHQNVSSTFYVEPTAQDHVNFTNEHTQGNTVRCKSTQSLRETSISDQPVQHPFESQQLREQNCNDELKFKHLQENSLNCSASQQQYVSSAEWQTVSEQKSHSQSIASPEERQIINENCHKDSQQPTVINREESVNTFSQSFENKLKLEHQAVICHDAQQKERDKLTKEKHEFKKSNCKVGSSIQETSPFVTERDPQSKHSIAVKNGESYKKQQTSPSSLTSEQKGINESFDFVDDQSRQQDGAVKEEVYDKIPSETNLFQKESILPHSQEDYNFSEMNLSTVGAKFFLVKCCFENDIYRSIRYNYWLSRRSDNALLEKAYLDSNRSGAIYLFFLVSDPGHLCGMAEMISSVSYRNGRSKYRTQKGKFNVRWIYIKDIHSQEFKHLISTVQQLSNVLELSHTEGTQLLQLMHNYKHATSIFDDFVYYGDLENSRKQHARTHRTKRK